MSLQTITEINLDINQPGIAVVHAKQYDTVRQVKAHLYYNGVKWLVPSSNYVAVVGFKKADRIGGFYDTTEDGTIALTVDASDRSIVYVTLDRNVLTTPGNVNTEITFYDLVSTGRLSTFSFITQVEQATVSELDLTSSPYFNILAEDIKLVIESTDAMTGLSATATKLAPDAEPTVSVTGGTSSSDPYVFNLGIPSMPGITVSATGISSSLPPSINITGGEFPGDDYNIAFGIPHSSGIISMAAKYGVSSSETTVPSSWVNTITELTIPDGSIMWVWIRVTYENGETYDYYSKAVQGYPGPPGVAVQTTEPDTNVKIWINPDDTQYITIPDIKDNTVALDSTYSSSKMRESFLAFDASQALDANQKTQAYSNLGFPSSTLGKLGYTIANNNIQIKDGNNNVFPLNREYGGLGTPVRINGDYLATSDGIFVVTANNLETSFCYGYVDSIQVMSVFGTSNGYNLNAFPVKAGMTLSVNSSQDGHGDFYPYL